MTQRTQGQNVLQSLWTSSLKYEFLWIERNGCCKISLKQSVPCITPLTKAIQSHTQPIVHTTIASNCAEFERKHWSNICHTVYLHYYKHFLWLNSLHGFHLHWRQNQCQNSHCICYLCNSLNNTNRCNFNWSAITHNATVGGENPGLERTMSISNKYTKGL